MTNTEYTRHRCLDSCVPPALCDRLARGDGRQAVAALASGSHRACLPSASRMAAGRCNPATYAAACKRVAHVPLARCLAARDARPSLPCVQQATSQRCEGGTGGTDAVGWRWAVRCIPSGGILCSYFGCLPFAGTHFASLAYDYVEESRTGRACRPARDNDAEGADYDGTCDGNT